jgi:hypothetical protein
MDGSTRRGRPRSHPLAVEPLEDRFLPATFGRLAPPALPPAAVAAPPDPEPPPGEDAARDEESFSALLAHAPLRLAPPGAEMRALLRSAGDAGGRESAVRDGREHELRREFIEALAFTCSLAGARVSEGHAPALPPPESSPPEAPAAGGPRQADPARALLAPAADRPAGNPRGSVPGGLQEEGCTGETSQANGPPEAAPAGTAPSAGTSTAPATAADRPEASPDPGPPLAGALAFDLPAIAHGVDDFLGGLLRTGESWGCPRWVLGVAAWVTAAAAVAFEFVRLRRARPAEPVGRLRLVGRRGR